MTPEVTVGDRSAKAGRGGWQHLFDGGDAFLGEFRVVCPAMTKSSTCDQSEKHQGKEFHGVLTIREPWDFLPIRRRRDGMGLSYLIG